MSLVQLLPFLLFLSTATSSSTGRPAVRGERRTTDQFAAKRGTRRVLGPMSTNKCKDRKPTMNSGSQSNDDGSCVSGSLYASNQYGDLFEIDYDTSNVVRVIASGTIEPSTELVFDKETGSLWSEGLDGETFNNLALNGTLLSSVDLPANPSTRSYTALEYVDGILYGMHSESGEAGDQPSFLAKINAETQSIEEIGVTTFGPISGMAYDETSSTLFGMITGAWFPGLVTIDICSGAWLDYNIIDLGEYDWLNSTVGSIAFDGNGDLRACISDPNFGRHELLTIDTATGQATFSGVPLNLTCTGLTLVCAD